MIKIWPDVFEDFVKYRTIELVDNFFSQDREYIRLQEELSQGLAQLSTGLDHEENKLFENYQNVAAARESRRGDLLYRQGLMDGLRLGELIDRISQGIK
jgi:hypothetical protein